MAIFGMIPVWKFQTESILPLMNYQDNPHDGVVTPKNKKKRRLLCFVMLYSEEDYTTRASHVLDSWGNQCDEFLWFGWKTDETTDDPNNTIPANHIQVVTKEQDTEDRLGRKAHRAWSHVCQRNQHDFDFYMKADLDTYMLMDNYFSFVDRLDPSIPHYFGKQLMELGRKPYPPLVAGASVSLSRAALQRVCPKLLQKFKNENNKNAIPHYNEEHNSANNTVCCESTWTEFFRHGDDLALSRCLRSVGVSSMDTRDEKKRERFMNLNVDWYNVHPTEEVTDPDSWYRQMSFNLKRGPGCCSPEAIAFHYEDLGSRLNDKLVFQDEVWQFLPKNETESYQSEQID